MNKVNTSSHRFSFGEINFQVDIDESLSAERRTADLSSFKAKALHDHPYYELFFVFDGETEIVFENSRSKYTSSVVCLAPGVRHYTLRSSDYRILFSFAKKTGAGGDFENFVTEFLTSGEVSFIPCAGSELKGYLSELCDIFYGQKSELERSVITSLLSCIFYRTYSLYTDYTHSERTKKQDYSISESRYITISNLISSVTSRDTDITVSTVAKALCLSEKQASRLIYKYYGKPLSEVITDEKLNFAAYLLKNTDHPIYDVAFESKFHSYSYFCNRFKKRFGCLPLAYRKAE